MPYRSLSRLWRTILTARSTTGLRLVVGHRIVSASEVLEGFTSKSKHFLAAVGALVLAGASPAPAQSLTEPQAPAIIAPWYSLFNVASRGNVKTIQEQALTPD